MLLLILVLILILILALLALRLIILVLLLQELLRQGKVVARIVVLGIADQGFLIGLDGTLIVLLLHRHITEVVQDTSLLAWRETWILSSTLQIVLSFVVAPLPVGSC